MKNLNSYDDWIAETGGKYDPDHDAGRKRVVVKVKVRKTDVGRELKEAIKNAGAVEFQRVSSADSDTVTFHLDFPTRAAFEAFRDANSGLIAESAVLVQEVLMKGPKAIDAFKKAMNEADAALDKVGAIHAELKRSALKSEDHAVIGKFRASEKELDEAKYRLSQTWELLAEVMLAWSM